MNTNKSEIKKREKKRRTKKNFISKQEKVKRHCLYLRR